MRVATVIAGLMASSLSMVTDAVNYGPDSLKDEITNLPNAPAVGFRMFSGYIPVGGNKEIFYWFVESQNNADSDPVMMWTNGGPGCSGLSGFMSEQGPFRPTQGGAALTNNDYAWNKVANMIFIEQPAGVGFSTAPSGYRNYTDLSSAVDMHAFLKNWFERFDGYKSNDMFITSESYGGHYMPTLALQIAINGDIPNFKGVKLGNPITFMEHRNYGEYGTYWGHQLYPKPLWDTYVANDCHTLARANDLNCRTVTNSIDRILRDLDPYALDFPICVDASAQMAQHERLHLLRKIKGPDHALLADYEPCTANWGGDYLNRRDVQQAIHIKGNVRWAQCSNRVSAYYSQFDVNTDMVPIWKYLLNNTDARYLIFSGDDDSVCATLGTQQFIWDMGFSVKNKWSPWKTSDGQVAGFYADWETTTKAKWALATVHGAGHMVPSTKPAQSLALLTSFLNGDIVN